MSIMSYAMFSSTEVEAYSNFFCSYYYKTNFILNVFVDMTSLLSNNEDGNLYKYI